MAGEPPVLPFPAQVKIRYKANEAAAEVTPLPGGQARVVFENSLRDITPGQRAVFYNGEECIGGGAIR